MNKLRVLDEERECGSCVLSSEMFQHAKRFKQMVFFIAFRFSRYLGWSVSVIVIQDTMLSLWCRNCIHNMLCLDLQTALHIAVDRMYDLDSILV